MQRQKQKNEQINTKTIAINKKRTLIKHTCIYTQQQRKKDRERETRRERHKNKQNFVM